MFGASGPKLSERCARRPSAAPRILSPEDQIVQSMADASPAKWHRAHTTWFFETFLLKPHAANYREFDERFGFLFNSYYVAAGPRHARPERGLITRPNVEEVAAYRAHVDAAVDRLLESADPATLDKIVPIVEIGLHHEQQHQELMLTDILHAFAQNPTHPAYDPAGSRRRSSAATDYARIPSGIRSIGFDGDGFCFDNEQPAHQVLLQEAVIARHLVTNREWLKFMADGGYASHDLWLSDGWAKVEAEGWDAPGYWRNIDGAWFSLTLGGTAAGRSGGAGRSMSATTRPTPSRAGPENICRPRPNGRLRPAQGCYPTPSAWLGNGPGAPICRIRPIAPWKARSANTTASS